MSSRKTTKRDDNFYMQNFYLDSPPPNSLKTSWIFVVNNERSSDRSLHYVRNFVSLGQKSRCFAKIHFTKKLSFVQNYLKNMIFSYSLYLPFLFYKHFCQMNIKKNIKTRRIYVSEFLFFLDFKPEKIT